MNRPFVRIGLRVLGVALIGAVLWVVGWNDRVIDTGGVEHKGRVVSRTETSVLLAIDGVERTIAIKDADSVHIGLGNAFERLGHRPGYALLGFVLQLAGFLVINIRWGLLLAAADVKTPWPTVMRLGFLGLFFQNVLPGGAAGGDVMRAVYVTRTHPERKARAVLSIFVDRTIGLGSLGIIAAVSAAFAPKTDDFEMARRVILGFLVVFAILLGATYSRTFRRWLGIPRLLRHLPFKHVTDELATAGDLYRRRVGTILACAGLALLAHLMFLSCNYAYGTAMDAKLTFLAIGVAVPIAMTLSAIPGLPGGWGVGDAAFYVFLHAAGVEAGMALAISFCFRLSGVLMALPGGLMLAGAKKAELTRENQPEKLP